MRSMPKRALVGAVALLVGAAAALFAGEGDPFWNGEVRADGALRAMFHEGKTGTVIDLKDLLPNPALYAVGASADLRGEITIVAGATYRSLVADGKVKTTRDPDDSGGAALLVSAEVREWQRAAIAEPVEFDALDAKIAELAAAHGLDPGGRFPFFIEAPVADLRWHVIDGTRLKGGGGSHRDHLEASIRGERAKAKATIVGFYSAVDQGVFTHMGSRTHLHVVLEDPALTGHVDGVTLPAGTTIRFPKIRP